MTPSERNTLLFLGALLLLGVSVRLVRDRVGEVRATREERAALAGQIAAVDSVRLAARDAGRGSGNAPRRNTRRSQNDRTSRGDPAPGDAPGPSVVYDQPLRPDPEGERGSRSRRQPPDSRAVDLDLASEAEIEGLPWIGPVLARRIIADRDSLGPFGSMRGFERVPGIGPGMARRLAGRVTFSQTPRHFRVEDHGKRASGRTRARPVARPRAP